MAVVVVVGLVVAAPRSENRNPFAAASVVPREHQYMRAKTAAGASGEDARTLRHEKTASGEDARTRRDEKTASTTATIPALLLEAIFLL